MSTMEFCEDVGKVVETGNFLESKTKISDYILDPKILHIYVLCLAKPAPRRKRLSGRRVDPQLHFQVYLPIDPQRMETQPLSCRLNQNVELSFSAWCCNRALGIAPQPRRQHPSTTTSTRPLVNLREDLQPAQSESEKTCTSALNSRPNRHSQRKSANCKRYRASLLSRPHDDCLGAAISRQASFA